MKSELFSRFKETQNIDHDFGAASTQLPPGCAHVKQVHGPEVKHWNDELATMDLEQRRADGLYSFAPGQWLGVQTADCIPLLFAAKSRPLVAAVHAGWRGVLQGIAIRTVEMFESHGVRPKDIVVAMGPAIGPCCFEIGKDVRLEFDKHWGWLWSPQETPYFNSTLGPLGRRRILDELDLDERLSTIARSKKEGPLDSPVKEADNETMSLWMDLKTVVRKQLLYSALMPEQMDDLGVCTYCGVMRLHGQSMRAPTLEFASYRRSGHLGQVAGRQWSVIQIL